MENFENLNFHEITYDEQQAIFLESLAQKLEAEASPFIQTICKMAGLSREQFGTLPFRVAQKLINQLQNALCPRGGSQGLKKKNVQDPAVLDKLRKKLPDMNFNTLNFKKIDESFKQK